MIVSPEMDDALDTACLVALVVALWSMGLGLGLAHEVGDVVAPLRRRALLARAMALDVVLLPLLVWALVNALAVPDAYATGSAARGRRLGRAARHRAREPRAAAEPTATAS